MHGSCTWVNGLFPRSCTTTFVRLELVFSVTQEPDSGFVAECPSHDIFTQAETWEALRSNVRDAAAAYFFDQPGPTSIRPHLVRDELLVMA